MNVKISCWSVFGAVCLSWNVITGIAADPKPDRARPDFGLILNEDGDLAFVSPDPKFSESLLREAVDAHAAIGVNTYVFCIGSGSDTLNYPTKVGSRLGWRETKYEKEDENWRVRIESARACLDAGLDAVRIAGEQAKKNGMYFLPSLRMNDSHFMKDPFNYPLTGKFWMDNAKRYRIGESPLEWQKNYGNLLDYTHEEVRNYRLAIIEEVVDRNKDIIDGFELDFNRVQVFFPKGKAGEGAPLITDLVRKVRRKLDQVSQEQGREMYLFVRVPPAMESCQWAGLEVEKWMEEGLIDLISPAQLMTLAHDMPIEKMTELARKYGVRMAPSLYPRTSNRVTFVPSESNLGMTGNMNRSATVAETLAAAANYRAMGADGFYLFNYYAPEAGRCPHPEWMYALASGLKRAKANAEDKVFAITKTYYNDDKQPSYAYVKQLPNDVKQRGVFRILVGEIPGDASFPLKTCALRLGLKTEQVIPEVYLNGIKLEVWQEVEHPKEFRKRPLPPDAAARSVIYFINEPKLLKRGENTVEVVVPEARITDLEIGYSYHNQLSRLLFRKPMPFNDQEALMAVETADPEY